MHKISTLIQLVNKATWNFIAVGEEIASENPQFEVSKSYHAVQQQVVD